MNPADQAALALRTWLKTETGYKYIQQLSSHHARRLLQSGSTAVYLGGRFSNDPTELGEELTQEFLKFLLASFLPKLHKQPDQVNMILNEQTGKVLRFALQKFTWQLQDAARKKDSNPRAYLHRRIREVLTGDKHSILHKNSRNNLSYSPAADKDSPVEDPAVFAALDYGTFPVPPPLSRGRDTLFTTGYLSKTAHFFQQQTTRQLHGKYAIPVRELVRYLAIHHSWINRMQDEALSDEQELPAKNTRAEEYLDRVTALHSIAALAAQFARGLDEQSCKILTWSLDDPPVSFKEMAIRLELSDHNRAYRQHQKIITALQKFTAAWPGPPLAELPDDVGLAFIEAIRELCEKSLI